RQALVAAGAKVFEPMKGRPMKEYVVAPPALVGDRQALGKWAQKAFAYGQSLPPKPKKPPKSKKPPKPKMLAKPKMPAKRKKAK
ncbi:MAG TPA: hypothetical protein VF945_04420, partial [Polyangia bacterium]